MDEGEALSGLLFSSWSTLLYHVLRIVGEGKKLEVLNTLAILCRDCILPRMCKDPNQYHHLRLQIATQLAANDHLLSHHVIDAMRWFLRNSLCNTLLPIKLLANSLPFSSEASKAFIGHRFMRRCFVQSKFYPNSIVYHALFAGQSLLEERYASAYGNYTSALQNYMKLVGISEDAESNARMQFALHAGIAVAAGKRSHSRKCTDCRKTLLTAIYHYQQLLMDSPFIRLEERLLMAARVAYLLERFSDAVRLAHRCVTLLSKGEGHLGNHSVTTCYLEEETAYIAVYRCMRRPTAEEIHDHAVCLLKKASKHLHARTQQEHYVCSAVTKIANKLV